MTHPYRPLIYFVATGISFLALGLTGASWWLTVLAFACLVLGLIVTVVQSVFPQESEHRLAWWRARWSHRRRRR
ncbi:hypothetical protein ACFV1U_14355 [Streptomyces microflavus]|uniref:hypothetical protein n=1 Tax=Streptomyces microflavus TaxID=1919 RepID=UPI0036C33055